MPRQPRIEIPGALYHVMARGVGGQDIFVDAKDMDRFLDRLGELLVESDHECYAWSFMSNHIHLLIRGGESSFGTLAKRLLTSHAVYFNRRHKRFGHLFQNRYKSILCQEDTYFQRLVRYIHLNPLRAGIVDSIKSLNHYKYAGHAYMVGKLTNDWQDTRYALSWFGKQLKTARGAYLDFAREGFSDSEREELRGGGLLRVVGGWKGLTELRNKKEMALGDERVLGNSDFVDTTLKTDEKRAKDGLSIPDGYDLDRLTEDVCQFFNVSTKVTRSPSKQRGVKKARQTICYIAVRIQGRKGIELAAYLNVSESTVSKLVSSYVPDLEHNNLVQTVLSDT